jgi:hypothetical protein
MHQPQIASKGSPKGRGRGKSQPPPPLPTSNHTTKGHGKTKGRTAKRTNSSKGSSKATDLSTHLASGKELCLNWIRGRCQGKRSRLHRCARTLGSGRACGGNHPATSCTAR